MSRSLPVTRLLVLLTAAMISVSLLAVPPATADATRAELTKKVKRYLFDTSLGSFIDTKRHAQPKDDENPLDWSDDGCSVDASFFTSGWNSYFNRACERHDFGYRNLGNGVNLNPSLALDSTEEAKKAIDSQFSDDMHQLCESYPGSNGPCHDVATAYYQVVSRVGQSWTSFYDKECTPGWFCLFDDTGFADRRKRFTVSHDDMNDFDFGDKASAVKNRTSDAWVIYDDNGYDDRNYCIPAGGKVRSLKNKWDFNDKTSSVKRLSTASCP